METKITDWTGVWRLPLWYDDCGYAWSKEDDGGLIMALTFEDDDYIEDGTCTGYNQHIVNIINGTAENDTDCMWSVSDGCDIYSDGKLVFYVRGWGHLTGGLKLSSEEAARIQDQFIEYILNRLNTKQL